MGAKCFEIFPCWVVLVLYAIETRKAKTEGTLKKPNSSSEPSNWEEGLVMENPVKGSLLNAMVAWCCLKFLRCGDCGEYAVVTG